jgi:5-methyltetrahydropteroyltriglutamate--homocysteine methyltransferase
MSSSSSADVAPFRADQVGSLLRPPALLTARNKAQMGTISKDELRQVEDECIRDAVRRQEEIGLQAITDGDFRRQSWSTDFLKSFGGVQTDTAPPGASTDNSPGIIVRNWAPPTPKTVGKLTWPAGGIQRKGFEFLKGATTRTPKVTIPAPSMLHFRGGRGGVDQKIYPDMEQFFEDLIAVYRAEVMDLAVAGCRYLQFDDTNLAYLCDPRLRDRVQGLGENPDDLPSLYARLINGAIKDRPADMKITVHMCRGNSLSKGHAEGGYEPVAEKMFNELKVDGFFLEYDDARSGDFRPLRFVPKGKLRIVLGVVTSKFPELEAKDDIKRRLDEASKFMPLDQMCLSAQCGFASHTGGNKITEADQYAKLRHVVEIAREVWD